MGFIQIILLVLRYGPAVFELISEIWDLIKKIRNNNDDPSDGSIEKRELNEALQRYRKTKDRGPLRKLRDQLRNRLKLD